MEKENNDLNESIDIFKIVSNIKSAFNRGWNKIISHKVRMIVFMFLFASIGVIIYYVAPTYYQAEMLISNNVIENETCKSLIESLQENHPPSYLKKNKKTATVFKNNLDLPSNVAKNLRSITYEPFNKKYERIYEDSIVKSYPFKIQIQTYDSTIFKELGQSIINYLKGSPYIEFKLERSLTYYINNIKDIDAKLKKLDSIQMIMLKRNSFVDASVSSNGFTINALDPTKITSKEVELFREKESYIQNIKSLKNTFPVIKTLYSTGNIKGNFSIVSLVILGLLIGFILGFTSIYLIPNRRGQ